MIVGGLAAVVHGAAFPGAMLLFGDITNAFVYHSIARTVVTDENATITSAAGVEVSADLLALTDGRVECTTLCAFVVRMSQFQLTCEPPYGTVNVTLSGSVSNTTVPTLFNITLEEFLKREYGDNVDCLDDDDFISEINFFIYLFIGVAGVAFLAAYIQILLFHVAAERQVHKVRLKFYRAVLRQDIAWFDVHSGGELSSWLIE